MNRVMAAAASVLLVSSAAVAADEVVLEGGDKLSGRVIEKTDMQVVLEHPTLGKMTIPAGRVTSVSLEKDKPPPAAPRWISKIDVGLNGSLGNTRNQGLIAGFVTDYKPPMHLWHIEARYFRTEQDGELSQSRAYGLLRKDWLFAEKSRTSVFAEGRYDRDQFQEWKQRSTAAAGVAYRLLQGETLQVGVRIGVAATKEWGLEGPERDMDVRPEGLVGADLKWKIDDRKEFTAQATYYPDLSDTPQYRLLATAGISFRLNDAGTLNLRGGTEYEYDTHRMEPFKRADLRYFLLLVMDF